MILGGAVIVEQVFNWPGTGRTAWQAAQDRDYPVNMGIAIVAAGFIPLGSLFQRVLCVMVNPRGIEGVVRNAEWGPCGESTIRV